MRPLGSPDRSDGFSLLEIMIALVIMGVITSQLFVMLNAQQRGFRGTSRTLDLQESTRLITDLIAFDTRNAGMLVPRQAAVASADGGNNDADRLCLSDGGYFPIPAPGASDSFWDNLADRFPGAAVQAGVTNLTLDTVDIDGRGGATDFSTGSGIILANPDGTGSHCAAITQIAGTSVTIDEAAPDPVVGWIAVPAILYSLDTFTLSRNGIPISSSVEDLQVEYWVDNSAGGPNGREDGDEFPIHDLNDPGVAWTIDTTRIRRVQISVVGISNVEDDSGGLPVDRHRYPGIANRNPGANADALKRQLFVTSVLPRNLLNPGVVANVP